MEKYQSSQNKNQREMIQFFINSSMPIKMNNQNENNSEGNCLLTKTTGENGLSVKSYCYFFILKSPFGMKNSPIIQKFFLEKS
jgi:hypothetical protein